MLGCEGYRWSLGLVVVPAPIVLCTSYDDAVAVGAADHGHDGLDQALVVAVVVHCLDLSACTTLPSRHGMTTARGVISRLPSPDLPPGSRP